MCMQSIVRRECLSGTIPGDVTLPIPCPSDKRAREQGGIRCSQVKSRSYFLTKNCHLSIPAGIATSKNPTIISCDV
jgi:hypothetical protein